MGNILHYVHNDGVNMKNQTDNGLGYGDVVDSSDISTDTSDYVSGDSLDEAIDDRTDTISTQVHRFRLPCGEIESYFELRDHGELGKGFKKIDHDWGTGPYREWKSMIVDKDEKDYKYLKPYAKDINGEIYKDDSGNLCVCDNCKAYAIWERQGDIMIRTKACTNCINDNYLNKIIKIQRYWLSYALYLYYKRTSPRSH